MLLKHLIYNTVIFNNVICNNKYTKLQKYISFMLFFLENNKQLLCVLSSIVEQYYVSLNTTATNKSSV